MNTGRKCPTGKRRFATESKAIFELNNTRRSGSRRRRETRYYPCKKCGGYHLTSWPAPDEPPG